MIPDITVLSKLSDEELVLLLKKGRHSAFEEIYRRYKGPLYLHALRMIREEEDAEDLLHELFSMLWSKASVYNQAIPLAPFLYRSLKNLVLNLISYKKVRFAYTQSLQPYILKGTFVTDEKVRENELIAMIEKEVSLLPEKMRHIFELSRKSNLSHQEIADQLQLSQSTVKKQVNNALKILRTKLDVYVLMMM